MDHSRPDGDLTAHEARVLGCLIEKESTTPDAYPLTVNSLRNACNQSTSRNPVMELTGHDVETALSSLRERGLTRTVHSTSNRATKYRHVLPATLGLDAGATALVAVLMLRGEQTVGELKGRTERHHRFESIDEVAAALDGLSGREPPLVRQLERQPGQKDARWIELLSAPADDVGAPPAHDRPGVESGPEGAGDPDAAAEFADLLATAEREAFGLQLLELLADVDAAGGPLVALGTGSGLVLPFVRAAVPGAAIRLVEPSRATRAALHTRLQIDDDLRAVTTIDPRPWADADLPGSACAVVASDVIGRLDDGQRTRLWRFVAERMERDAPAVVELPPLARPAEVPRALARTLRVGEFVYEAWWSGEPVDDRTMVRNTEYRVLDRDDVVAEFTVRNRETCLGADDIRAEIAAHGLVLSEHDRCVAVRRPA